MANAANTRNVRNSKSRQYAQDRNKFGGSSAPKKDSPNYADKSMRSSADSSGQPKGYSVESKTTSKPKPDYSDRTLRSSADSSGQPKNYSSEPASKAKPNYSDRTLRSSADTSGQPKGYSVESSPKSSSTAAVKDKMVSGLEKAAKKVPAYEAIKGIPTSKVATGLGRAAMLEAGPAIAATVLAESADKYGRERGFGLQPRDVPKSSMSKKSDSIVDAINAEPKSKATTAVASKSEGTSPRTDYKPLKDMVSVKEAPAASKPALKSGTSKPKGPTEGDRARNSMAAEWAAFSKGREADTAALKDITDRYDKTGTLVNLDDENARTKTEATEASEYKKGGMTKRPPKPAKKVPARKFASGGSTSRTSASKRGDGCATKGHTKGNMR